MYTFYPESTVRLSEQRFPVGGLPLFPIGQCSHDSVKNSASERISTFVGAYRVVAEKETILTLIYYPA